MCARFGYALSWRAPVNYTTIAGCVVIAVMCFFHLREVGRTRLKLKAGVLAAIVVVIIAAQTLQQAVRRQTGQANFARINAAESASGSHA